MNKTMPIENWMYDLGVKIGFIFRKVNYPFAYRFSNGFFDAIHKW